MYTVITNTIQVRYWLNLHPDSQVATGQSNCSHTYNLKVILTQGLLNSFYFTSDLDLKLFLKSELSSMKSELSAPLRIGSHSSLFATSSVDPCWLNSRMHHGTLAYWLYSWDLESCIWLGGGQRGRWCQLAATPLSVCSIAAAATM